jgi:hypothetical protein
MEQEREARTDADAGGKESSETTLSLATQRLQVWTTAQVQRFEKHPGEAAFMGVLDEYLLRVQCFLPVEATAINREIGELIERDRALHRSLAVLRYQSKMVPASQLAEADVHLRVRELVALVQDWLHETMATMPTWNHLVETASKQVEGAADEMLDELGLARIWSTVAMPAPAKNFFERHVSSYGPC